MMVAHLEFLFLFLFYYLFILFLVANSIIYKIFYTIFSIYTLNIASSLIEKEFNPNARAFDVNSVF